MRPVARLLRQDQNPGGAISRSTTSRRTLLHDTRIDPSSGNLQRKVPDSASWCGQWGNRRDLIQPIGCTERASAAAQTLACRCIADARVLVSPDDRFAPAVDIAGRKPCGCMGGFEHDGARDKCN